MVLQLFLIVALYDYNEAKPVYNIAGSAIILLALKCKLLEQVCNQWSSDPNGLG